MTASTATCGCCTGASERTPLEVANRPGLSAIEYRVGTHADFLASMVAGLTRYDRPELSALGTREPDDFTMALLDAWAVVADVLTFYQERLANEAFLQTAHERTSLNELARLIGYQPRPGVAAETYLAFALEQPPELPAAATKDPGTAPPVTPAVVKLPPRLRIQSIPGPDEKPQTFETVEEIEARPEWNSMPATATQPQVFAMGVTRAYLAGAALNLKPGDLLLLVGTDVAGERWDVRTLTAVDPEPELDRTRVEWAKGLGSPSRNRHPATHPQAFLLRKRIPVFGHNAPAPARLGEEGDDWEFDLSPGEDTGVDLDGSQPDVVENSWVVLAKPTYRELWRVDKVSELSRVDYGMSGKVTRLRLAGGENYDEFAGAVRETTVFAAGEPLALADAPDESPVTGAMLEVEADVSTMRAGRRLVVRGITTGGEEGAETAVVQEVQGLDGRWRIVLENPLAGTYRRETVIVHGNVARATHGETVHQLLGSGRAVEPFQRFTLAHRPLTHVQSSASAAGAEPALQVRVNDVAWQQVPTLHGAGPQDRVYALRSDTEGRAYVQFGDGRRGARLPSGSNNVRAQYRTGLGAAGNVGPGAVAQLLDRPLGVKGAANPLPASGGAEPESDAAARRTIPLGVRTLERAVSLLDYEDFARAFAGVSKASATAMPLRGERTIVVSVAFDGGERTEDLAQALRGHGDPRVAVLVVKASVVTFRLALRVATDPARETDSVLAAVEAELREAYSFERRGLGEPVIRSQLVAVIHAVAGVLAVDVDRLYTGPTPGLAERLPAPRAAAGPAGTAIPAGTLVLDEAPFDWLEAMA